MKRNYLTVPGQRIEIRIEGDTAVGKGELARKIVVMAQSDGLMSHHHEGLGYNDVTITCPTPSEARDLYLETLGEHEIATLRGHLDALGYEL